MTAGAPGVEAVLAASVLAVRLLVGSVFVLAGVAKARDGAAFRQAVDRYRLLPAPVVSPFAATLPWVEIVAGGALAAGLATPLAAGTITTLLLGFAVAAAVNLARGRKIHCGCSGAAGGTRISWWLVARNSALAGLTAGVALAASGRVRAPLADIPAGDAIAAVVTVVAVLGTARLVAHAMPVRAALHAGRPPVDGQGVT